MLSVTLRSIQCYEIVTYKRDDVAYEERLAVCAILLANSAIHLMVSLLLLCSAYCRRPKMAVPWLTLTVWALFIDVILFIVAVVAGDLFDAILVPIVIGKM